MTRVPTPTTQPPDATVPPQTLPARRLPLGVAVLLLALAAALLGAGAAILLEAGLGATAPWAALWGAVLGVAAAALPMAALALKLGRQDEAGAEQSPVVAASGVSAVAPRALFFALAEREWSRARRYGTGAALLLVDIDRFSRLCDAHGNAAGDAVAAELLRNTAATLRGADVLTRFSDSQMAIFLAQADATGALDVAERIRERAERLDLVHGQHSLRLTVSVGVAHLRTTHPNLQSLIEDAQEALAAARQAGGNCVRAAPLESSRARRPGSWRDDRRTPRQQPRP